MAAALENEKVEDKCAVLNCTLCNEELKKPKLLSCQHSFCTECLAQRHGDLDEGMLLCCPTCQMNIELKDDTVESIPNNYLYDIITDAFNRMSTSETKCVSCAHDEKTTTATHKCLDCGDTFCQHCNTWHCKCTATRHHIVVAIADLLEGKFQDEFSKRKVLYCDIHSTVEHQVPLTSYCHKCRCLVCTDCMQGDHNGHTITKLHAERLKQQELCDEKINTLQMSQKEQDARIGNIKRALLDTNHIWGQQETDINNTATELYALVDKIKNEKLKELKSLYEKELQYLDDLLKEETNTRSSLQATVAFTQMFVEKCSDSDFLYHDKDIRVRMEKSEKRPSQHSKRNLIVFEKQEVNSVKEGLGGVFGRIETQKHSLHRSNIGQVKEQFKRTIYSVDICGLSYSENHEEIFLVGQGERKINILSKDGHLRRSIRFEDGSVDIDVEHDTICVTNNKKALRKVVIMDRKGLVQNKVRLPDDDQRSIGKLSLVVGEDNCIFIVSTQMQRIYKWHPEEDNMSIIISKDMGHTLSSPQYICMTPRGELVVSNHGSQHIQIYSKEGEFQWQYNGKQEGNALKCPSGVCCDEDGYIYVVDRDNCRIQVIYDKKLVGMIPLNQAIFSLTDSTFTWSNKVKDGMTPLISTSDGGLIYGNEKNLIKISFWE